MSQPEVLHQAFELGYTYTRSTGPIVGRFLTELKRRKIVGIRSSDGRVIVLTETPQKSLPRPLNAARS